MSAACDYCGLPLPGRAANDAASPVVGPHFCCFGCRFAAQVTQERGEEGSARWTLTRLGLAVFFTMNVVMLSMALWSGDWYAVDADAASRSFVDLLRWGALVCSLPVLLLLGPPLAENAYEQARRGIFSTDGLLLTGVVAAYVFSAVSVLRGDGQVYFEVGCVVLVMVTLGRWFDATGRLKASAALDALEKLLPAEVRRLDGATETTVPLESVRPGDRLRVLAGERFPTDGRLVGHAATVDEQFLTGESWPAERLPGEAILGGSLNLAGESIIEVTAESSRGTLARLIAIVRNARLAGGHWQKLADRVSSVMFPAVTCVALAALGWHVRTGGWERGLLAALSVLLIACPCALGLATPLAVWTALGAAARRQVLFRNGEALERLATVRTICFDKTGTLTTGEPRLARVLVDAMSNRDDVEREAARLASGSTHVLSRAILSSLSDRSTCGTLRHPPCAGGEMTDQLRETQRELSVMETPADSVLDGSGIPTSSVACDSASQSVISSPDMPVAIRRDRRVPCDSGSQSVISPPAQGRWGSGELAPAQGRWGSVESAPRGRARQVAGRGMVGWSDAVGGEVMLGSARYLAESGLALGDGLRAELERGLEAGHPAVVVGWGGRVRGAFLFEEELRPEATDAIRRLGELDCAARVLTGDHAARGAALERELGVPVTAGLLPEDKVRCLESTRAESSGRGGVAMVGDGVNDAPSLAAADVGIALGCGADLTRDAAGVCLLGNDLGRIPWAIDLARRAVRTIRVNLFWSFAYNVVGVGLAAAGWLNPALAAGAMVVSSVLVVTHSLRLGVDDGDDVPRETSPTAERAAPIDTATVRV